MRFGFAAKRFRGIDIVISSSSFAAAFWMLVDVDAGRGLGVFDFDLAPADGLVMLPAVLSESSSSSPKDSLIFPAFFTFFLNGGCGDEVLYFDHQLTSLPMSPSVQTNNIRRRRRNLPISPNPQRRARPRCRPYRCRSSRTYRPIPLALLKYFCTPLPEVGQLHKTDSLRLELVFGRGVLRHEARRAVWGIRTRHSAHLAVLADAVGREGCEVWTSLGGIKGEGEVVGVVGTRARDEVDDRQARIDRLLGILVREQLCSHTMYPVGLASNSEI